MLIFSLNFSGMPVVAVGCLVTSLLLHRVASLVQPALALACFLGHQGLPTPFVNTVFHIYIS